eukprot:462169_1
MIRIVAVTLLSITGIYGALPFSYMTDGPNPKLMYTLNGPNIPGAVTASLNGSTFDNCMQVAPNFNFHWAIRDGMFKAAHEAYADENRYFAFGIIATPPPSGNRMAGADAIITYFDQSGSQASATDYTISGVSGCVNGRGVCPDVMVNNGDDNVFNVSGYLQDGIHVVSYVRPLVTGEANDLNIVRGSMPWLFAQGEMNADRMVTNHGGERRGVLEIDLGRPSSMCFQLR